MDVEIGVVPEEADTTNCELIYVFLQRSGEKRAAFSGRILFEHFRHDDFLGEAMGTVNGDLHALLIVEPILRAMALAAMNIDFPANQHSSENAYSATGVVANQLNQGSIFSGHELLPLVLGMPLGILDLARLRDDLSDLAAGLTNFSDLLHCGPFLLFFLRS